MNTNTWRISLIAAAFLAAWTTNAQAVLTAIGPNDFTSTNVIYEGLNGNINTNPIYTFSSNTVLYPSNSNQLARTGINFIGPSTSGADLRITMTFGGGVDVFEAGAWFGNDDPTIYGGIDFVMLAFDRDSNYLGSNFISANYNDTIDQFLGLRSDVALGSAVFYMNWFERDRDGFVALDDFQIGYETAASPVAAPATLLLLMTGLFGFGVRNAGLDRNKR